MSLITGAVAGVTISGRVPERTRPKKSSSDIVIFRSFRAGTTCVNPPLARLMMWIGWLRALLK